MCLQREETKKIATNQQRGRGSEKWKNNLRDEQLGGEEPEGKKNRTPGADEEKAKRLEVARVVDVDETGCIGQPPPGHGTEGQLVLQQRLTCDTPEQEVNTSARPFIREVHFYASYSKRKRINHKKGTQNFTSRIKDSNLVSHFLLTPIPSTCSICIEPSAHLFFCISPCLSIK
jgi:hypothetical protein